MHDLQDIDKAMNDLDSEDYDLKTDIGYKFLLNWSLKKIAEGFMSDSPLSYISLEKTYSGIEFLINFFPYFKDSETLKKKITITINGNKYDGFDALKVAGRSKRAEFYYFMLSVLRDIMTEMDKKKLLLQSYATVVFGYDGGLNAFEK